MTEVRYLPLPGIFSREARKARIVDELKISSLLSPGKLTDDGCEVKLNRKTLLVKKQKKVVLTGHRNRLDELYDFLFKTKKKKPTMKKPYYVQNIRMKCLTSCIKEHTCKLKKDCGRQEGIPLMVKHNKKPEELAQYLHG